MIASSPEKHIFMSYSRRDEETMRRIVTYLRRKDFDVWVDNEELVPGTPIWEIEIEKAIKQSLAVVVLLSPDSNTSIWVRREITFAERYHKRVFPILIAGNEDTSIMLRLVTSQYVDIRENERAGLNSVKDALISYRKEIEKQEQRARILAERAEKEKAAREKAEREAAEKIARENAEREAVQKAAREKAEREAAEKAVREKAEREAEEKAARENAEREAAQKAAREKAKREAAKKSAQQKKELEQEEQNKRKIITEQLPRPNSLPKEIPPSKPTSLPQERELRKKPKDLPK